MRIATSIPVTYAAAFERAAWYVSQYGTAAAALSEVEQPGYNDAFERDVCQELRHMRFLDAEAARVAVVEKASLYLAAA